MDPETLAQGIETYLASLQEQAAVAEMLYLSGEEALSYAVLRSMERRMGFG
jgi:hypothetical protein